MPKAADYDKLTTEEPGHEMPYTPKPASSNAGYARKRAIRDGRLICHPRAEIERAEAKTKRAELLAARSGSPTRFEPAPEPEEVPADDELPFDPDPDPDDTGDTATAVDPDEEPDDARVAQAAEELPEEEPDAE